MHTRHTFSRSWSSSHHSSWTASSSLRFIAAASVHCGGHWPRHSLFWGKHACVCVVMCVCVCANGAPLSAEAASLTKSCLLLLRDARTCCYFLRALPMLCAPSSNRNVVYICTIVIDMAYLQKAIYPQRKQPQGFVQIGIIRNTSHHKGLFTILKRIMRLYIGIKINHPL